MNNERYYIIEQDGKKRLESAIEYFAGSLAGLRAGKSSSALVSHIKVECYGGFTPIMQLANISTPDSRTIMIQAWDSEVVKPIEKAIIGSSISLTPSVEGSSIRIVLPELTQERRQELCKQVKKYGEEAKIVVRNIRRDLNDELKKLEKDKLISEDESKGFQNKVQKLIDDYIKKIDDAANEKTEQIMKV